MKFLDWLLSLLGLQRIPAEVVVPQAPDVSTLDLDALISLSHALGEQQDAIKQRRRGIAQLISAKLTGTAQ